MKVKFKSDLANFERCQHFLQLFNKQRCTISNQEIHKFIGRFDRTSIRNVANFKPLQQMMRQLTPRLISDKFIASNSHMMSNLTSILANLNFYEKQLMDHSSQSMLQIIRQNKESNLQHLNNTYRAFVQLNEHGHQPFLSVLRLHIKNGVKQQLKEMIEQRKYLDHQYFLKKLEILHKYIRTLLLDPNLPHQFLSDIFQLFQSIFKMLGKNQLVAQQHFLYQNCAVTYEYVKVFEIQIEEGIYFNFIKGIYQKRRRERQKPSISNESLQFQRKGESVFENRFQKNLHLSGYWFQSNIKIGLNQYDVLVKGIRRQQFIPFSNITLQRLKQGKFTEITSQQKKIFENMKGLWYIDQKKRLKEDLIINLNGPYHYIEGDKSGLVRSQAIKQNILKYYGYSYFKAIDYRVWQRQTNNQRAIKKFFQNTILF